MNDSLDRTTEPTGEDLIRATGDGEETSDIRLRSSSEREAEDADASRSDDKAGISLRNGEISNGQSKLEMAFIQSPTATRAFSNAEI